ncbi:MAG: DUF4332 domain-containing protein [Alphaproteobacteria bacterium]|nr:DUF4332 domain-containing protein [Alphaproteobacteria bacterium]
MTESQAGFMPDLSLISLDAFKHDLRTGRLLPSRRPLLDRIDEHFAALERAGIHDLAAAQSALGSAGRLKALAAKTGLSEDYLKLLRREINSVLPTPVVFRDVPNMPDELLVRLDDIGIADTAALFPHVRDPARRKTFAVESGLPDEDVLWLAKLVDVSRIKWTGPKLARLIVDTEFDTVEKLANAEPAAALAAFKRAKAENKAYDGPLGIDDIESWIGQIIRRMPKVVAF